MKTELPVRYIFEKPPTERVVILNTISAHPEWNSYVDGKKHLSSNMIKSGLRMTKKQCLAEDELREQNIINHSVHNYNRTGFSNQRQENLQRLRENPTTVDHYIMGSDIVDYICEADLSNYKNSERYGRFSWIENNASKLTEEERNEINLAGLQATLRKSIYSHFEYFDFKKDQGLQALVNSLPELIENPDYDIDENKPYITINFKSKTKRKSKKVA